MKIFLLIFLVTIFIILAAILIFVILNIGGAKDKSKKHEEKISNNEKKQIPTIKELIDLASNNELSRNELFLISKTFIDNLEWPKKNNEEVSEEAKVYLDFILLVSSHKNTDAKIITFLNTEAKKKNPSYVLNIEEYENLGIQQRKNRK